MECPTCGSEMQQLFTSYVCDQCEDKDKKAAKPAPHIIYPSTNACLIEGYIECSYDPMWCNRRGIFHIRVYDRHHKQKQDFAPRILYTPNQVLFEWFFRKKIVRDAVHYEWLLFNQGINDEVWIPLVGAQGQSKNPLIITAVTSPPSSQLLGANFKEAVPGGGVNNLKVGLQTLKAIHQFWKDILAGSTP